MKILALIFTGYSFANSLQSFVNWSVEIVFNREGKENVYILSSVISNVALIERSVCRLQEEKFVYEFFLCLSTAHSLTVVPKKCTAYPFSLRNIFIVSNWIFLWYPIWADRSNCVCQWCNRQEMQKCCGNVRYKKHYSISLFYSYFSKAHFISQVFYSQGIQPRSLIFLDDWNLWPLSVRLMKFNNYKKHYDPQCMQVIFFQRGI